MDAITGNDVAVAAWLSERIGAPILPPYTAIGFGRGDAILAAAVFNDYTPGNVEGAELIRKWADAGYFPSDINAIDYASFVSRFQAGEGLFTFNGNWAAADTQAKMGDDVAFCGLFAHLRPGRDLLQITNPLLQSLESHGRPPADGPGRRIPPGPGYCFMIGDEF